MPKLKSCRSLQKRIRVKKASGGGVAIKRGVSGRRHNLGNKSMRVKRRLRSTSYWVSLCDKIPMLRLLRGS